MQLTGWQVGTQTHHSCSCGLPTCSSAQEQRAADQKAGVHTSCHSCLCGLPIYSSAQEQLTAGQVAGTLTRCHSCLCACLELCCRRAPQMCAQAAQLLLSTSHH